jgi:predicted enzyme related to lactoylglutathione lyase
MIDGTVSYLEIGTAQAGSTGRFFSALFDWPLTAIGDAGDGWFDTGSIRVGFHGEDPEHGIVPYFHVADIEGATARVRSLGGIVDEPGADEPGFGRFRNCRDAAGVRFGLHQPA